jgi:hypothetical protein
MQGTLFQPTNIVSHSQNVRHTQRVACIVLLHLLKSDPTIHQDNKVANGRTQSRSALQVSRGYFRTLIYFMCVRGTKFDVSNVATPLCQVNRSS